MAICNRLKYVVSLCRGKHVAAFLFLLLDLDKQAIGDPLGFNPSYIAR